MVQKKLGLPVDAVKICRTATGQETTLGGTSIVTSKSSGATVVDSYKLLVIFKVVDQGFN